MSLWQRLVRALGVRPAPAPLTQSEQDACREFCRHYNIPFQDLDLLALALTHRSYLHVGGPEARESNERLEFLGDSVLGLVVTEHLYQTNPHEHEGQLTKTKSLLVSKAILSRRALAMGLGRFVLMSHSEVESGGRQRLSILADAFEAVIGAIYLDQGYPAARAFIERWLLRDTRAILSDKRHTNYKSQLQEFVQSNFRTHPIYHIRSEMGPDHSKVFVVDVLVGRRTLGEGRGRNKKEAEQAAARDALEALTERERREHPVEGREHRPARASREEGRAERAPSQRAPDESEPYMPDVAPDDAEREPSGPDAGGPRRRRRRRGGRGRGERDAERTAPAAPSTAPHEAKGVVHEAERDEPPTLEREAPHFHDDDDHEEVGRPEVPFYERPVAPDEWRSMSGGGAEQPTSVEHEPDAEAERTPADERPEGSAEGEEERSERDPTPHVPSGAPAAGERLFGRRPPRGGPYRR